jgi:hypothetical protein
MIMILSFLFCIFGFTWWALIAYFVWGLVFSLFDSKKEIFDLLSALDESVDSLLFYQTCFYQSMF